MFRFILFLGFLVGIAYVLTAPPETETAFTADEIPVGNDKPLLTSWGPTLGSLRNGVPVPQYAGDATTLVASNDVADGLASEETAPITTSQFTVSDGATEAAALAVATATSQSNAQRNKTRKPERPTTTALRGDPTTGEPEIDRVAAALPPQRRGLFGRVLPPPRIDTPRGAAQVQPVRNTRQVQAAPRNRGLFKRLRGRGKQPARAWALGPAR